MTVTSWNIRWYWLPDMGQLASFTPKEIIRILEKNGFVLKRINGSHHIYTNPNSKKITVVPMHSKDLPKGTFYAILRQAGIDKTNL